MPQTVACRTSNMKESNLRRIIGALDHEYVKWQMHSWRLHAMLTPKVWSIRPPNIKTTLVL